MQKNSEKNSLKSEEVLENSIDKTAAIPNESTQNENEQKFLQKTARFAEKTSVLDGPRRGNKRFLNDLQGNIE